MELNELSFDGAFLGSLFEEATANRYAVLPRAIAYRDGSLPRLWDVVALVPVKSESHQYLLFLAPSQGDIAAFVIQCSDLMVSLTDTSGTIH